MKISPLKTFYIFSRVSLSLSLLQLVKSQPTETFLIHIPHPPPTTPGHEEFAIGSAVTKASDNLVICEREDSKMVSSL